MQSRRTCALVLTILLCLVSLNISIGQGQTTTSVRVNSTGLINYGFVITISVGFENPDDVKFPYPTGLTTTPQQYVFQSTQSAWTTHGEQVMIDNNIVDQYIPPVSVGVRPGSTGSYVLREWLKNPYTDYTRRIHIRHLWNPLTTTDIWMEGWVYFPPDFPGGWTEFWSMLSEREWTPAYVDAFAFSLNFPPSSPIKNPDSTWKIGTILNFYWPDAPLYHNYPKTDLYTKTGGMVIGEWNYLKTHVHRPIEAPDPTTDNAGGYLEVWIANSKTNWQPVLQDWYEQYPNYGKSWGTKIYCRTIGEKPEILATFRSYNDGSGVYGQLDSGFDLYTDVAAAPREILFDDVTLSDVP